VSLTAQQQKHLDVLRRRRDFLVTSGDRPTPPTGYTEEAGFFAGEANALAWVISVMEAIEDPVEARLERVERRLRTVEARLGNIERDLAEEDEEEV